MNATEEVIGGACQDAAHMGEFACTDRLQCWEPCGCLGKSEAHVAVAEALPADVDEALRRLLRADIHLMEAAQQMVSAVAGERTRDVPYRILAAADTLRAAIAAESARLAPVDQQEEER